MSDMISRDELLRYVNDRIGRIKEIRDRAKVNGEEDVFAHCNGEIAEARRTRYHLNMFAPVVDAVPVVRCKDCIFRGAHDLCPMCVRVHMLDESGYIDCTVDDGFCNRGKKVDGGEQCVNAP